MIREDICRDEFYTNYLKVIVKPVFNRITEHFTSDSRHFGAGPVPVSSKRPEVRSVR